MTNILNLLVTCKAAGLSLMVFAARCSDLLALCSPSAATTLALASLAASASAAMALINCSGTLTSANILFYIIIHIIVFFITFHLHPLHVHTPRFCGLKQQLLHVPGNGLSVRQDLLEALGAEDVPERGGGQQPRGGRVVVHVGDRADRVPHLVEHDRVHKHRHTVLRQDLGTQGLTQQEWQQI